MANVDIPIPLTLRKLEAQTLGLVIWNFPVQSMFTIWWPFFIFFIMANIDILFPLTLGKPDTQTLGNLKFFHTINIYKMVVILHFFHNSQCWYSVSIDTEKTGDPNFGGWAVDYLKFLCTIDIYKMVPIFQFVYNGRCWYSISSDTQKFLNFLLVQVFSEFSLGSVFSPTHPRFSS